MLLPRYESYKDSGVEWLGEIPEEWSLWKGFQIFKENKEKNRGMVENTVLSLSHGRIVVKPEEKIHGLVPESFEGYQIIEPTDTIIRTTDLQNDQTSLRCGYANDHGIITSAYLSLKSLGTAKPKFIYYALHSYDLLKVFYSMGSGLRQNLDFTDFKRILVPIPSANTQKRIVSFLDQKTAEIDEAITKKKALIKLLQEQKSILINQAVTKGLNHGVSKKNSGIEWVGDIPTHWELQKAKYLFDKTQHLVHDNDGIVTAFRDGQVTLRTNRRTGGFTIALQEKGYQGVKTGQLVVNSMDAFAGAIGISDSDGKCSPEYVVFDAKQPSETFLPFYAYLLRNMAEKGYIQAICPAVRQRALRFRYPNLAPVLLPTPKINEQKQIVEVIEKTKSTHLKATNRLSTQINLLNEFKQSLISSVVTGKIKV